MRLSLIFPPSTLLLFQVVKVLGPNVHLVHKELVVLLQDNSLEVREMTRVENHIEGLSQGRK